MIRDRCDILAELGSNHQGDMSTAFRMIEVAYDCGVDAVKLQKRDNRSLYTKEMFDAPYNSENAYGPTYGSHREALEFGVGEWNELFDYAKHLGVRFGATAFDIPSVEFLVGRTDFLKIASGCLSDTELIRVASSTGLPLIVSTGGGDINDVRRAWEAAAEASSLTLLQCTASYPTDYSDLHLNVLRTLAEEFASPAPYGSQTSPAYVQRADKTSVGVSLHCNGIAMAVLAYGLGARTIEQHVTLDRTMKGTDHALSLEPQGLRKLVRDIRRAEVALGSSTKQALECEKAPIRKMSKALFAARDLDAGMVLQEGDIKVCSPGGGLPPYRLSDLLHKPLRRSLRAEEPFSEVNL